MTRLLDATATKWRLAAACGIVLVAGALLAPLPAQTTIPAPQERVAPLLEEQVQLRATPPPFRGVQDVALQAQGHGVAIPPAIDAGAPSLDDFSEAGGRPPAGGFGVVVSETGVLTHAVALGGRSALTVVTADGRVLTARLAAYEAATGLVLLHTEPSGVPPAVVASRTPVPGMLAVAVGRWDGRDVAVPVFVTSADGERYRVAVGADALRAGLPVYDLDGGLLALAAGDGDDAVPIGDAVTRLTAQASRGSGEPSFGVAVQELAGALIGAFGEGGVLVNNVVSGGPADAAGVQPGDVLLAVGGVELDAPATAVHALRSVEPGTATALRLRRAGVVRTVDATAAPAFDVAFLARAGTAAAPSGPEAHTLFPDDLLAARGIPATARVLSVNGRAVTTRAQAQAQLRGARRPVPLLLQVGSARYFVALEPVRR